MSRPSLVLLLTFVSGVPALRAVEPTEYEQYALELLNRARANPPAEVTRTAAEASTPPSLFGGLFFPYEGAPSLNEGPPSLAGVQATIPATAKQPLAFNTSLMDAARNYAAVCRSKGGISHTYDGTSPTSRMTAVGYTSDFPLSDAVSNGSGFTGPGGETLFTMSSGAWNGSPGLAARKKAAVELAQHNLFVDAGVAGRGHRLTQMASSWKEIGIGFDFGADTAGNVFACADAGFKSASQPFITGVAYRDLDGNGFYTPGTGEALGGQTVQVFAAGGSVALKTVTTFASGGYAVQVPPNASYDVRFSGTQPAQTFTVTLTGLNLKQDWVPAATPAAPFAVTEIVRDGGDVVVTWSSVAGVAYRVQTSPDLAAWAPLAGSQTTATGTTTSWRHVGVAASAGRVFYRIERL